MKIYFAGSIRGGRDDVEIYSKIINYLKKYGQVLTEHVGSKKLTDSGEPIPEEDVYTRDMTLLKSADVLVAEVSTPSLGVGYEIAKAEEWKKSILCLYRKVENNKKLSTIIEGNKGLMVKEYVNLDEAFQYIDDFLAKPGLTSSGRD